MLAKSWLIFALLFGIALVVAEFIDFFFLIDGKAMVITIAFGTSLAFLFLAITSGIEKKWIFAIFCLSPFFFCLGFTLKLLQVSWVLGEGISRIFALGLAMFFVALVNSSVNLVHKFLQKVH